MQHTLLLGIICAWIIFNQHFINTKIGLLNSILSQTSKHGVWIQKILAIKSMPLCKIENKLDRV